MDGAVIIVITILACIFGYAVNKSNEDKYGTPAVNWAMIVIQCVFMLGALLTFPNPDVTWWFILWCVLSAIAYVMAMVACRHECVNVCATKTDTVLAIMAQLILPLGFALLIIIALAIILGGTGKKKKKR